MKKKKEINNDQCNLKGCDCNVKYIFLALVVIVIIIFIARTIK
ncbi:MAG: hypothetical protein PHY59_02755 [Methanobacterium sp.]|nr:hypothetical protein [Methanobacterium sp.]